MSTKNIAIVVVLVASTMLSACSSGPEATGDIALDGLRARVLTIDAIYLSDTVVGSLPNQTYRLRDGQLATESDEVVVGRITAAEVAAAYRMDGEQIVQLADPLDGAAWWRMLTLTVAVERYWGANPSNEVVISMPVSGPEPVRDTIESLKSLGTLVLILKDRRVVHNEEYLGVVNSEGLIEFPILEDQVASTGISTVDALWRQLETTPEPREADLLGLR